MKKSLLKRLSDRTIVVILTDSYIFDLATPFICCETEEDGNAIFDCLPDYWVQQYDESIFRAADLHRSERYNMYIVLHELCTNCGFTDLEPEYEDIEEDDRFATFEDYNTEEDYIEVEDESTFDEILWKEEVEDNEEPFYDCQGSCDDCCGGCTSGKGCCGGECKVQADENVPEEIEETYEDE